VPVGASFAVTLDAPAQKVEALVDVGDQRLVLRKPQADGGQDRRYFRKQRLGVRSGSRNQNDEVVRLCRLLDYAERRTKVLVSGG
jgi:hypothetical protein